MSDCNCKNGRCCVPQKGERGLKGERGVKGDTGADGPMGPAGNDGNHGNDGADATTPDSGWVDLLGFDHYGVGVQKPQCRLIGKVMHFRGLIILPLSSDGGATLIPMTDTTTYQTQYFADPYTGVGGVTPGAAGDLDINKGAAVIPSSVLSGNLDGLYRLNFSVGTRQVKIDANDGTFLSGLYHIIIYPNKSMKIVTMFDGEQLSTIGGIGASPWGNGVGSSPLRYVSSNVTAGSLVRDLRTDGVNGNTPHQIGTGAGATSVSTDSYAADIGGDLAYPFDCDAALTSDIGGFVLIADGLMAYTNP